MTWPEFQRHRFKLYVDGNPVWCERIGCNCIPLETDPDCKPCWESLTEIEGRREMDAQDILKEMRTECDTY